VVRLAAVGGSQREGPIDYVKCSLGFRTTVWWPADAKQDGSPQDPQPQRPLPGQPGGQPDFLNRSP